MTDLKARAERLRELHGGEMLVLPNACDAASARIVAEAGFPAVATASAAVSAMLGYPDGEGAPWQEMFAAAGRVARAVSVPVTVDAEAGYGMRPRELVDRLLDIGAVGCNLEDTDHRAGGLAEAGSTGTPAPTASTPSACATGATSQASSPNCPARSTATPARNWTWPPSGSWAWRECPTDLASTSPPWPT